MSLEKDTAHRAVHNLRNFRNRVLLRQLFKVPNIFVSPTPAHRHTPLKLESESWEKAARSYPFGTGACVSEVAAPARLAMQLGPPYRMATAVAGGFRQVTATRFDRSKLVRSTPISGTSGNDEG